MDSLHTQLHLWAEQFHKPTFIANDPIQMPHRYQCQQDIEISGFLTAYLSFGRRVAIIDAATRLDTLMQSAPRDYVLSEKWVHDFQDIPQSFYRTVSHRDMLDRFRFLHAVYAKHESLETYLYTHHEGLPIERLLAALDWPMTSAQKKMNMFLRWMIRKDSPVDLGCWSHFSPNDLLIPLDTHVHQTALKLGITRRKSADFKTAAEITDFLKKVFPGDPCLGDFALFGYGEDVARLRKG